MMMPMVHVGRCTDRGLDCKTAELTTLTQLQMMEVHNITPPIQTTTKSAAPAVEFVFVCIGFAFSLFTDFATPFFDDISVV